MKAKNIFMFMFMVIFGILCSANVNFVAMFSELQSAKYSKTEKFL